MSSLPSKRRPAFPVGKRIRFSEGESTEAWLNCEASVNLRLPISLGKLAKGGEMAEELVAESSWWLSDFEPFLVLSRLSDSDELEENLLQMRLIIFPLLSVGGNWIGDLGLGISSSQINIGHQIGITAG